MSKIPPFTWPSIPPRTLPTSMDGFLINGKEPNFEAVLGLGWKPRRLLGRGSNGVVRLWEYEGNEIKTVKQIAIKQTHDYSASPLVESQYMDILNTAKSIHIVRQYRDATAVEGVVGGGVVVTMFLEYCPAGDLTSITRNDGRGPGILEVDLWALFYCLASAGAVLDRGTEDMDSEPVLFGTAEDTIVHFDLKPDNVFLGQRDPTHDRYPVLKLGDFGNAQLEPKAPPEKSVWMQPRNRGALGYKAPEDYEGHLLKSPRKGACSNTFQLGCIMYNLVHRDHLFPASEPKQLWQGPFTKLQYVMKYTMGAGLFQEPWASLYSKGLRELIMECMMWEPDDRPGSLDLQKRVLEGGNVAWDIAGAEKLFEKAELRPVRNFEEPVGSGLWETF